MKYTVRRGDSLSKIARAHGTSLGKLLDANPRYKANPNRLGVGDVLNIPGSPAPTRKKVSVPVKRPAAKQSVRKVAPGGDALGSLSAKYETGGRGPGTVSSGTGDRGGVSYGSYQMTSKPRGGTVSRFVSQPGFPWRAEFEGLTPGTPPFSKVWRQLAGQEPDRFHEAQHAYIKKTHYDPLVKKIRGDDGLRVNARSHALKDVVWSTAVQHGPNNSIVHRALRTVQESPKGHELDRVIIKAIYTERGRRKPDGNLTYFSRNSAGVQKGVARRFVNEEKDALKMLEGVA